MAEIPEIVKDIHAMSNRTAFKISRELKKGPSYANRIAENLNMNEKLINFQFAVLKKRGLVKKYEFRETGDPNGPYAATFFMLTDRGVEIFNRLDPHDYQ